MLPLNIDNNNAIYYKFFNKYFLKSYNDNYIVIN